ncbi:MAG: hypothetical protein JWM37_518 [Candidatus Saccharibacteria bacterium]|nr:hypothetical protein [Candidatus Saccharibacteria bacterium]
MNLFTRVKSQFAGFSRMTKTVALTAVLMTAAAGVALSTSGGSKAVEAANCTNNDIIKCGASTPADFIAKTNANATGDLPAIYADYGLVNSQFGKFVSTAKMGTAMRDGRIVVDGMTVATDTSSIGRTGFSYSHPKTIGGKTYYESKTTDVQKSDIPVMVMFDDKGVMQFAVLTACANPINGKPVTPSYSCDQLNKTAVPGKLNTYQFSTKASAANNATVTKVVYDFGDGTKVEKTNPAEVVEHTYSQPGNYVAQVTVSVKVPGSEVTVTSANCKTPIKVQVPFFRCVQLAGVIVDQSKRQYQFTTTASFGNGATFKSASVDYGDGTKDDNLTLVDNKTITVNHTYASAGSYTVTATLVWNDGIKDQSVTCTAKVTPEQPPVSECKPGVAVGSPECSPCEFNSNLPSNSPQCVPAELPHTGTGSTIGLFAGATLFGGLGHFILKRRYASQA